MSDYSASSRPTTFLRDHRPTIYESFNARFLDPQEVGSNFVYSPFLRGTLAPQNTAVLGPRGSGKTTLLKMLTLPALLNWKGSAKDSIASELEFLAVYVPYSLTWSADYRGFSRRRIDPEIEELLSISLFRHNLLLSILETWIEASKSEVRLNNQLSKFHLPINPDQEPFLVRELADLWEIETPISTINGLRAGINRRIRRLQKLSVAAVRTSMTSESLLRQEEFLSAHFLDDCSSFADFLAEHFHFRRKVALCFDELEIASDSIANAILRAPRSLDQRFLIKFSAAPYVGAANALNGANVATQRNDYELIFLSSFSPQETHAFSEALFQSLCLKHGFHAESSYEVLGASFVDDDEVDEEEHAPKSRYQFEGSYQRRFQSLYEKDRTFSDYVDSRSKQVNINDLTQGSENLRAAGVRKIIWPVIIREEFLFRQENVQEEGQQRRRLRTTNPISNIYTGSDSLFAICEGNPRSIKGLLEPMVEAYSRQDRVEMLSPVKRSLQKVLVEGLIAAYFALISTVPNNPNDEGLNSLLDIVYRIGSYFGKSVLGKKFNPDPVLSFFVDEKVTPAIRELVGRGVNMGAFVTTREGRTAGAISRRRPPYRIGDLAGLKVRLSNTFAPHFRIPLAGGRTINLSTILERGALSTPEKPLLELFGEKI